MYLTYKYRLKGKRAVRQLNQYAKAVNIVWNYNVWAHKKVQRDYKTCGIRPKMLSRFDLQKLTSGMSEELGIHSQTIQNVCQFFTQSRDKYKKCPRFRKNKGSRKALGWVPFQTMSRQLTEKSITYKGNTYGIFGHKRRPIPVKDAKAGAFVEDSQGRWWVVVNVKVKAKPSFGFKEIGIDLGLKSLAVTSEGDVYENHRFYKQNEQALAKAQRDKNKKLARKINEYIKNTRKDYLHKLSTNIVKQCKTVYVGNVSPSRLGRTHLSKSIYDVGWYSFTEMLRYKASMHEVKFVKVNEAFSTQTCSACRDLPDSRPIGLKGLDIRKWTCSSCGAIHDRDTNAAKNILKIGQSALPLVKESSMIERGALRVG